MSDAFHPDFPAAAAQLPDHARVIGRRQAVVST